MCGVICGLKRITRADGQYFLSKQDMLIMKDCPKLYNILILTLYINIFWMSLLFIPKPVA